jgi:DNA integrity scanning protein DisA with diadenylate cyclase activity
MLLGLFGFLKFSFTDVVDILMVAAIIFFVFRWIRGSSAMNIFIAVILLFVLQVIVVAFDMKLMSALLGTFLDVGVLALILAARSTGLDTSMKIVLAFLAFVAIAGNWLRWYRSR